MLGCFLGELIHFRLACVRLAALLAATIGTDYPNTSTVTTQLPAIKINRALIVAFSRSIRQLCLNLLGRFTQLLTTPAAVLTAFG